MVKGLDMISNAVPPSVTYPSPYEWPQDLIKPITLITRDREALVQVMNHGFTAADEGITFVAFKQVEGMSQINGLNALIQSVIDADNFTVNIDSTNFYNYLSNGVIIVLSGVPPEQRQGMQIFNRPFQNIANVIGMIWKKNEANLMENLRSISKRIY